MSCLSCVYFNDCADKNANWTPCDRFITDVSDDEPFEARITEWNCNYCGCNVFWPDGRCCACGECG